jgi:hypothetical protein
MNKAMIRHGMSHEKTMIARISNVMGPVSTSVGGYKNRQGEGGKAVCA